MIHKKLIAAAVRARKMAYAPYSRYKVGAAIETISGRIFTGCNVENASFGATCCAERVVLFKAISEGEKSFKRIAICAGRGAPCPPCGTCRQVLHEFAPEIEVVMINTKGTCEIKPLSALLPFPFSRKYL